MVNATVARNIVGIIGNVISLFLFASPIPTLIRIYKKGSVEEYKADPYLATVLNCALWVFYGLPMVTPDSTLVLTINATGLLIELFYLSFYLFFAPKSRKVKVGIWIVVEMAFVGIVATLTLKFFHTHKQRSSLVGILCVVFVSLMYISPLTIMGKVIKTKSVKYMPFYLSLANFLNGLVWVIYALIKFDLFILIGNGLGTLSGAVQLILYACYYKTTPKDEEEEENNYSKPSELQLSRGQAARASA